MPARSVPRTGTAAARAEESAEAAATVLLQGLPADPLVTVEQPGRILVSLDAGGPQLTRNRAAVEFQLTDDGRLGVLEVRLALETVRDVAHLTHQRADARFVLLAKAAPLFLLVDGP